MKCTTTLLLFLLFATSIFAQKKASKQEWIPLFNGKNLKGWDIKIAGQPINDNYKNTFRVKKGVLQVSYDKYEKFDDKYGHLYYKTPYSYYILEFEYRFTGEQIKGGAEWNVRNSGIMLHSQSAQSLSMNQGFPISLEMQLLGGLGIGPRHTGNLCTPGTQVFIDNQLNDNHCIDSNSKTYDGDQWVRARAIVLGDSVVHHLINGDTVLTYQKPRIGGNFVNETYDWVAGGFDATAAAAWTKKDGTPLSTGYIALQAESHPIEFRKIELLNLQGCMDPKAVNYKSYCVQADNEKCVYRK